MRPLDAGPKCTSGSNKVVLGGECRNRHFQNVALPKRWGLSHAKNAIWWTKKCTIFWPICKILKVGPSETNVRMNEQIVCNALLYVPTTIQQLRRALSDSWLHGSLDECIQMETFRLSGHLWDWLRTAQGSNVSYGSGLSPTYFLCSFMK